LAHCARLCKIRVGAWLKGQGGKNMDFALNEEQVAIRQMAQDFADDEIAPFALEWDQDKHFPVDTIRKAGALGMGGIYIRDDVGGSGLGRMESALIIEALATACPAISS